MKVDVQRLRALLAAATPGPWMAYGDQATDSVGVPISDRRDFALIAAMRNEIEGLLAIAEVSEWQPIDSAPTVGVFLTFHPRFGQRILTADPHNPGWFKDATGYPTREATHWRPLPKAPEGLVRVVGEE